jgi:hypothetical protein
MRLQSAEIELTKKLGKNTPENKNKIWTKLQGVNFVS